MYKYLWKKYREKFIRLYLDEQNSSKYDFSKMEYVFSDNEGRKHFKFANDISLPIQRMRAIDKDLGFLAAGTTPEFVDKISEAITSEVEKIINPNAKGRWEHVTVLAHELKFRNHIVSGDILVNVIARQVVREDEDPNPKEIDEVIHREKINFLATERDKGTEFFFRLTGSLTPLDLSNSSPSDLKKLLQDSLRLAEEKNQRIETISSNTLSPKKPKPKKGKI